MMCHGRVASPSLQLTARPSRLTIRSLRLSQSPPAIQSAHAGYLAGAVSAGPRMLRARTATRFPATSTRSAWSNLVFRAWLWRGSSRKRGGRAETAGLTDRQVLHDVLSQRENRYLARQLCYVLTIAGLETYILQPRDPA